MTLEKTENNIPKNIPSSPPPLTARLLKTDEILLSMLLLAWSGRIQREIQILGDESLLEAFERLKRENAELSQKARR